MGAPLEIELVLAPVDGSDEATDAVEYAVAVAATYGARVHAMYVLGEEAAQAVETGVVDADDAVAETQSVLESVRGIADREGVPVTDSTAYGFSTESLRIHPGSVVLDAAEQMDADFIVVPREPGVDAGILEKAAEYVLLYASQPVLSV